MRTQTSTGCPRIMPLSFFGAAFFFGGSAPPLRGAGPTGGTGDFRPGAPEPPSGAATGSPAAAKPAAARLFALGGGIWHEFGEVSGSPKTGVTFVDCSPLPSRMRVGERVRKCKSRERGSHLGRELGDGVLGNVKFSLSAAKGLGVAKGEQQATFWAAKCVRP